jgi:outer membrane protein OmpA-like peptidoglycan-associated protein
MRRARVGLALLLAALVSACAYVPPGDRPLQSVSPDYLATGPSIRAYIYGNATVLEPLSAPAMLAVRDRQGDNVPYERLGRVYRLASVLSDFSVWANAVSTTFIAATQTRVFGASPLAQARGAGAAEPTGPVRAARSLLAAAASDKAQALRRLCELQLAEIRALLAAAERSSTAPGAELFAVDQRLRRAEDMLSSKSATLVRVSFPVLGTNFQPNAAVAEALVIGARNAAVIRIAGYTDSRIAGPLDARIARDRAADARRFLIEHGIEERKIHVASHADGEFAAPNGTAAGRAINRRVEIELVHATRGAGTTP